MLRRIDTPRYEAFLSRFRLPEMDFQDSALLPATIRPVWTAFQAGAYDAAVRNAKTILSENQLMSTEVRAAVLAGLAAAELAGGATDQARMHARQSLELFPAQWAAERVIVAAMGVRREYHAAYESLSSAIIPDRPTRWDMPLSTTEFHTALASWSWLTGQWDVVAEHLLTAYPDGLAGMPDEIREDWFRLSLYRDQPDEAAAAASLLVPMRSVDQADEIMQTFVQAGWFSEALPLYRDAFDREPQNELLRRRLVALCIKNGDLEEARRLAAPGALRTAA